MQKIMHNAMDEGQVILFYILLTGLYACMPESIRPSSWIGWILFIFMLLFLTPVIALPVSIAACYYLGPIYGE